MAIPPPNLVPSGKDATIAADTTVPVGSPIRHVFDYGDFGFDDSGDGDPFFSVIITDIDLSIGALTYDGVPVVDGSEILVDDLSKLIYTAPDATIATGVGSFKFQVTDTGTFNNVDLTPNTITLDVGPVNSRPEGATKTITVPAGQTYDFSQSDFWFSDGNEGTPANEFRSVLFFYQGGSGGFFGYDGLLFSADHAEIAVSDLNKLQFFPIDTGANVAYLSFQVRDDGEDGRGGSSYSASGYRVTFNVQELNHAPSGANKTITYDEDAGRQMLSSDAFGFSDSADADTPNNLSQVIVDAMSGNGVFMLGETVVTAGQVIDARDLSTLSFQAAANAHGDTYASLTFRLRDDGGTTNGGIDTEATAHTLTFNITSVNDAPSGADATLTYLEDSGKHQLSAAQFGFADAGNSAAPDSLSKVIIDGMSGEGTFLLGDTEVGNGDVVDVSDLGQLTFEADTNGFGTGHASLTFRLVDDGGTANGGVDTEASAHTLTFDITAVSDAPSGANKTITYKEDSGKHLLDPSVFGFSDMADALGGNDLSEVIIDKIAGGGVFRLGRTEIHSGDVIDADDLASLSFTSAKDGFGGNYASLRFRLVDDGDAANGGSNTETTAHRLTFNITDVTDTFRGTAGKDALKGTAGQDVLDGKGGDDRLTGLDGADSFVFGKAYGKDVVADFDRRQGDVIDLAKAVGIDSFGDLKAHHVSDAGSNVRITADDGSVLTISGIDLQDLAKDMFQF